MILMVKHYPTTWYLISILKWNGLQKQYSEFTQFTVNPDENLSKSYLCHLKEIIFQIMKNFCTKYQK